MFRRGPSGAAVCNMEVGVWEEAPPLEASEEELLVAETYRGLCLVCLLDIEREERRLQGAAEEGEDCDLRVVAQAVAMEPHGSVLDLSEEGVGGVVRSGDGHGIDAGGVGPYAGELCAREEAAPDEIS